MGVTAETCNFLRDMQFFARPMVFTEPFIVFVNLLYFFLLDKILSIDKIDSLYFHGSFQCVVIQKFTLNVVNVQSSNFIQVLILTKNHHFSKLLLIYGITTMKSI